MLAIAQDWVGGIDEFVAEANGWLARLLPEDRAGRPKDEVNARLVRHYTTSGLLPAPRREGREARYNRLHLLHLLALRRLMADGLSGKVLFGTLSGRSAEDLERLAQWGAEAAQHEAVVVGSHASGSVQGGSAMDYLRRLRAGVTGEGMGLSSPALTARAVPDRRAARSVQMRSQVLVRRGLEVLVGEQFRWPRDEAAWEELLDEVRESLRDVQERQRGASGDDA
ncbi:MerR family transcriptional regulator [Deinococcus sp. 14RED07]|uniref:MerR family transcriptional regulator n=1 Tax=Deinococcus sp. 14RED07 TaxID=2745874 RepID=UPI001E5B9BEC|nr:MerR family transcriptional regulator [Deinococcus sp. 14RED07]MCD0174986.1 MerR family transcriptional regulator [Deinococcus sp. 14RED07]